jgi:hypothetical protein
MLASLPCKSWSTDTSKMLGSAGVRSSLFIHNSTEGNYHNLTLEPIELMLYLKNKYLNIKNHLV